MSNLFYYDYRQLSKDNVKLCVYLTAFRKDIYKKLLKEQKQISRASFTQSTKISIERATEFATRKKFFINICQIMSSSIDFLKKCDIMLLINQLKQVERPENLTYRQYAYRLKTILSQIGYHLAKLGITDLIIKENFGDKFSNHLARAKILLNI